MFKKNTVATFTWVSWRAQDPGGGGVAAAALRPGVQQHVARREARARDAVVAGEHEADLDTWHVSRYNVSPPQQLHTVLSELVRSGGRVVPQYRPINPPRVQSSVFYIGAQTYVLQQI